MSWWIWFLLGFAIAFFMPNKYEQRFITWFRKKLRNLNNKLKDKETSR